MSLRNKTLIATLLTLFATISYSNKPADKDSALAAPVHSLSFVFQAGAYWGGNQGDEQHIEIEDLIGNQFTVSNHSSANALFGVGIYTKEKDMGRFRMSYGINGFYLPNGSINGIVVQENLFPNLSYEYTVAHYPVYLMAQSSVPFYSNKTALTLDAGIGPNFLSTSNFREYSIDPSIFPDNSFASQVTPTFSATAGIGLRFNQGLGRLPFECGYRFYYLGKGSLKINNTQVINELGTGTTYANALLCSVRI